MAARLVCQYSTQDSGNLIFPLNRSPIESRFAIRAIEALKLSWNRNRIYASGATADGMRNSTTQCGLMVTSRALSSTTGCERADFLRNAKMVKLGANLCPAPNSCAGLDTTNCAAQAIAAG